MQALARKLIALLLLAAVNATGVAGEAAKSDDPFAALKGITNSGQKEFLDPDQAFVLTAEAVDASTVKARWAIADGYYLYRDKFTFRVDGTGVSLGDVKLPAGEIKEDPYFGQVEIMHGTFDVEVPIKRDATAASEIQLTLG